MNERLLLYKKYYFKGDFIMFKKLIHKIYMYTAEKKNWNAKMAEPLKVRIVRKEAFARLEELHRKGTVTDDNTELATYREESMESKTFVNIAIFGFLRRFKAVKNSCKNS